MATPNPRSPSDPMGTGRPSMDLDEGRVMMGGRPAGSRTEGAKTATGAGIVGGAEDRGFHDGPGPQVMAADTLEGNDVVNRAGEKLGEIKEIMLDVAGGRIAYAVLSFGGLFGVGDKLFAIPWSALTLDADHKEFMLDVDKERLERAPGFDKDHWPAMADMKWASDIHSYYGRQPYWH